MLVLKMNLEKWHLFFIGELLCVLSTVCANVVTNQADIPQTIEQTSHLQLSTNCPKTSVHVLLPHPSDCQKFFTCDHGVAHPTTCQKGLHFNQKRQACDYPEDSGCKTEVSRGKDDDGTNSGLCPAEKTKHPVYRPHSTDCGKFYVCDGGIPHLKICKQGLHFNTKINACDYPQNAGCGSSMVTESPRVGTGGCPAVNSRNPVFLPHKMDCRKFYICDSGVPHLKTCQSGLHFNPKLKACDYPAKAGCESNGFLLSVVKGPSPFCPTIEGDEPVFFHHPSDCSMYFMCSNGFAYKFKCPARLHFNLKEKICDYEWVADCPLG